jgi:GNAT superfamily N-acetyltransferase
MTPADIPIVDAIGEIVHPDFPEDRAVMENRLALFPDGCLVAESEGTSLGYAVAHPDVIGRPAVLNTVLEALPADADCLFLHDVALSEAARGYGLGKKLVPVLKKIARAHGFTRLGLVSVNNSLGFWQAQGFAIHRGDDALAAKLATYDDNAAYMVQNIVEA